MLPERLSRECHSQFPAYHHEGERRQASIRYIVLHVAEAPTAQGVARYFMQPDSGGSANLVVDDFACYRSLGDNVIPWGAPPLNTHGFHIEHAGYAAWSRTRWLTLHRLTIRRGAYKAALRSKWYGIPVRLLDAHELEQDFGEYVPVAGQEPRFEPGPLHGGVVTHHTINEVYHQSDHSCPGPNFPVDVWMRDFTRFRKALDL